MEVLVLFAIFLGVQLERNSMIFREVEKSCDETWERVMFNVSLWASLTKHFFHYIIDLFC